MTQANQSAAQSRSQNALRMIGTTLNSRNRLGVVFPPLGVDKDRDGIIDYSDEFCVDYLLSGLTSKDPLYKRG